MSLDLALVGSVALMGAASMPHCAAMCGSACHWGLRGLNHQTNTIRGSAWGGFLVARALAYGALGWGAQSAVAGLREWMTLTAWVKPLWTLLHLAALVVGLWLLVAGRWTWAWHAPEALKRRVQATSTSPERPVAWPARSTSRSSTSRAALLGALWVLWPCTMLWAAVMTSALSNQGYAAFLAMVLFALVSSPGLWGASRLWRWLEGRTSTAHVAALADRHMRWALRLAGALLVVAAVWSLGHDLLTRFWAWCVS